MRTVPVERPALKYFGGKWSMAPWIIERLPGHRCYVEPFCGAASVLLRKEPSKVEVLNDRNGDVVRFFRVLRERSDELVRALELTPNAADELKDAFAPAENEVEAVRRFFVQSWQAFNGGISTAGRGFRRFHGRSIASEWCGAVDNLYSVASRLRAVTIENLDWSVIVDKYDRRGTCFYVDPPYLMRTRSESRASKGYGSFEIESSEHIAILDRLNRCKASVALSGYADPVYDLRLAGWARHERVVKGLQSGMRTEVLWVKP